METVPAGSRAAALAQAAERLEGIAPGYLARARRLAAARGLPPNAAARVGQAIDLVDEAAQVDADAPTLSASPGARTVKTAVGRFVRWYMLYMAGQVSELGASVSWLGRALFDYASGVEAEVDRLRAEVVQLRARVEELEGRPPPG